MTKLWERVNVAALKRDLLSGQMTTAMIKEKYDATRQEIDETATRLNLWGGRPEEEFAPSRLDRRRAPRGLASA